MLKSARISDDENDDNLTQTELIVSAIWSEVLQCDEIGPEDNFFEQGGDSIMMMMAIFRVNEELNIDLPPGIISELPTLREFCRLIDKTRIDMERDPVPNASPLQQSVEDTGII